MSLTRSTNDGELNFKFGNDHVLSNVPQEQQQLVSLSQLSRRLSISCNSNRVTLFQRTTRRPLFRTGRVLLLIRWVLLLIYRVLLRIRYVLLRIFLWLL
jgi:hypothetical protein